MFPTCFADSSGPDLPYKTNGRHPAGHYQTPMFSGTIGRGENFSRSGRVRVAVQPAFWKQGSAVE